MGGCGRWTARGAAWGCGILLAMAAALPAAAQPGAAAPRDSAVLVLPTPTGPYAVGTADWFVTDSSRADTLDGVARPRRLRVVVWYPAPPGAHGQAAPYLRSGAAEFAVLAGLTRRPMDAFAHLARARSHGVLGAAVAGGAGRLPVVLLSHGYLSTPSVHTAVAEELASHGYAVLAIAHTGEAQAVAFPDGSVVTMVDSAGHGLAARPRAVLAEWGPEDSTMTAVTSATGDVERRALLRRYLGAIPVTTASLARWTADVRLVLGRALAGGSPLGRRLDAGRVGALGHSFGGVTAAEFCRVDRRCRAALNLDGIPQYGAMIDRGATRPFLMLYTERDGRVGASDAIYRNTRAPYWRAVLARSRHLDPSDWALFGPGLRRGGGFGTVAPGDAVRLTNRLVLEWFDQELRGRRSPLLSGARREPGLTVERVATQLSATASRTPADAPTYAPPSADARTPAPTPSDARTPAPTSADAPAPAGAWTAALADTLLRLGREDQDGREALARAAAAGDTATLRRSLRADSARSLWLRRAVREHGWPTRASMADSAAHVAWLILQHSPFYDWQGEMLPTLERLAARGELPPPDLALFTDRVLVHRGQPQRYGTQFDVAGGRLVPARIADLARLDALRAGVGLPPMAEYARMLGEMYGMPVAWPPAP